MDIYIGGSTRKNTIKIAYNHLKDMDNLTSKEKGFVLIDEINAFAIKKEKLDGM